MMLFLIYLQQGTFLMLIPGMMLLVTGLILFFTDSGDTWRNGMIKADVIFIVLGAVMLGGGSTYCSLNWCRVQKRKSMAHVPAQWTTPGNALSVQLVGFSSTRTDHGCLPPLPDGAPRPLENEYQSETQT